MLAGDTKILTVYEGQLSIKDLVGREILVYSWSPETKLPTVGLMKDIQQAQRSVPYEITFDSGLKIICAMDQGFSTFRGERKFAFFLNIGESIRAFSGSINLTDGHQRMHGWVNGKARHVYLARAIWEFYNGKIENGWILHHKDFDKLNNDLDNLVPVTQKDHNILHGNFRKHHNHKIVDIKISAKDDMDFYFCNVDYTNTFVVPDETPVSGNMSGVILYT